MGNSLICGKQSVAEIEMEKAPKYTGILKKALLIGINYTGTDNELNGCINDSENLKNFIINNKYVEEENITMLNDKLDADHLPTKDNILKQFNNIVQFCSENKDKLVYVFVSYSGHGYYQIDMNGDETDGQDEVLCPIDCDTNGFIVDDDIKRLLIDKLGPNVKLVFLSDSCHSGTVLDLKYTYKIGIVNSCVVNRKINDSKCDVVLISGCSDSQTSADAFISNSKNELQYQGAMTASFIKTFHDKITYKALIEGMRKYLLKTKFTQIPQLTSGKKINVQTEFLLCEYD